MVESIGKAVKSNSKSQVENSKINSVNILTNWNIPVTIRLWESTKKLIWEEKGHGNLVSYLLDSRRLFRKNDSGSNQRKGGILI